MDPTACWERMRSALKSGEVVEAIYASVDLATWLNSGGFMPEVEYTGQHTRESYVWAVLSFLMALDPDDDLRATS